MVSETMYRLVQVGIVAGIVAVIGSVVFFMMSRESDFDQEVFARQAELSRYSGTAGVYRGRTGSYDGVCTGFVLTSTAYRCTDSDQAYAIEIALSDGSYACMDSTGYNDIQFFSKGTENTVCIPAN